MWLFLSFLAIRKISNELFFNEHILVFNGLPIDSFVLFFCLKISSTDKQKLDFVVCPQQIPFLSCFYLFFFCFLWHNYSTVQGFWNKGSNMSSILWYSKLIPNISIFYFHFFLKKFYWYRINAQSKFFLLKSHNHDFYISLTLQTPQNVFTLVNTLASVLRFNSNPIFFEQSVKVT